MLAENEVWALKKYICTSKTVKSEYIIYYLILGDLGLMEFNTNLLIPREMTLILLLWFVIKDSGMLIQNSAF